MQDNRVTRGIYRLVAYKYRQLLFCRYAAKGDDGELLYRSLEHESIFAQKAFPKNYSLNIYQKGILDLYNHLQGSLLSETEYLLKQRANHLQSHRLRRNLE